MSSSQPPAKKPRTRTAVGEEAATSALMAMGASNPDESTPAGVTASWSLSVEEVAETLKTSIRALVSIEEGLHTICGLAPELAESLGEKKSARWINEPYDEVEPLQSLLVSARTSSVTTLFDGKIDLSPEQLDHLKALQNIAVGCCRSLVEDARKRKRGSSE